MLELRNIKKVYKTVDEEVQALKGVSLKFRESEFVSILGQSGCGKTTLLNIIGGLDRYTSGDLIINGVSTKKYKDRDWDTYRNHKIGFIFQSYNLISHQSVLANVELALTISGISKKERRIRAIDALTKVGLKEQIKKKPNQLSGGQMQRVAIARALVNNPDIILADEPTGALDTKTSVQVMDILREISKDKLIIMVTHNQDLAEEYSSRIIRILDGEIISDSNPIKDDEIINVSDDTKIRRRQRKASMGFLSAIRLSLNNLLTKKARTILVSFAGSIGIIGIALILALSTGFQEYIDKIQEDTLSSYPLTVTSESADITSMLLSMVGSNDYTRTGEPKVIEEQYITNMFSNIKENDLKTFKNYIEKNKDKIKDDVTDIEYSYSVTPIIYTIDSKNKLAKLNPSQMMSSIYSASAMSMFASTSGVFNQLVDNKEEMEKSYDVLAGKWPTNYDEVIIALSTPEKISDFLLYSLGLRDTEELNDIMKKIMSGEKVDITNEPMELTYDELMNIDLRLIEASDTYKYNSKYKIYEDMSDDDKYMKNLYENATKLKVVGIIAPKEDVDTTLLGVCYTSDLVKHIIGVAKESEVVQKQLLNKNINVFTNKDFDADEKQSTLDFEDMISIDKDKLSSAFGGNINEEDIKNLTTGYIEDISKEITADTEAPSKMFLNNLTKFAKEILTNYIANPKESVPNPLDPTQKFAIIHLNDAQGIVDIYMEKDEVKSALSEMESNYVIPSDVFKTTYSQFLVGLIQGYVSTYYATDQSMTTDPENPAALIMNEAIEPTVKAFSEQALVIGTANTMAQKMLEAKMQKSILTKVGELTAELMTKMGNAFKVDQNAIASAFKFNLTEEELQRIMNAMLAGDTTATQKSNLISLGYQDLEEPTSIAFFFSSFEGKERFLDFIQKYNDIAEANGEENKVIQYTDATGILMGSVKKIVDSVSYVLIAFVSISLVVSSIMIGIITYISVLERTKEIGILRAIGASKRNISSIFNAETLIIGLLSGLIGIGISLGLIIIINDLIHKITENYNLNAVLPVESATSLVILSVILTLIGGLIPSRLASKRDPVIALRTE